MIRRDFGGSFGDALGDVNEATNTLMSQVEDLYSAALRAALLSNAEGDPVNTLQHSIRANIDQWSSTKYNWAAGDHGPNGTYDWSRWFEDGKQIGMAVQSLIQTLNDQNVFSQISQMLDGMAQTTQRGLVAFSQLVPKAGAALETTIVSLPLIIGLGFVAFMYAKGR